MTPSFPKSPSSGPRILWPLIVFLLVLWGAYGWWSRDGQSALFDWGKPPRKAEPLAVEPQVLNLQESFAKVAEAAKPAVVSITTVHVESYQAQPFEFFFGDPFEDFFHEFFQAPPSAPRRRPAPRQFQRRFEGMGSGVIIDPRGYVLTNEHVIRGADELKVTLLEPEEKTYTGKVVGKDPRTDLAVIKINAKGDLPSAILGDSDKVRVGDWAVAVGSPFGLEQTVTVGVISAVRQSLSIEGHNYANLLQTDAAINRGNSGGPLINIRGEVIGINTAIYAPTGVFAGIGFAIPVNRAKVIMEQLIEKGRVVRGWMGVEILSLNDVLAKQFQVPDRDGVIVNNVLPGSPAEKAGLQRGDVIREFNGKKVSNQESLIEEVGRTPPKTRVKIKILRDGKAQDLFLTTGEMPSEPEGNREDAASPSEEKEGKTDAADWEGARLAAASPALLERFDLPRAAEGVLVTRLEPGGLAERLGLAVGDLVVAVNRQKTPDVKRFLKAVEKADVREGILLDVNRRGQLLYLSLRDASE